MTNVIYYATNVQQSAGTYTYHADGPTLTSPRVASLGTGAFTPFTFYIKVAISFLGQFVRFNNKLD